jgi:hypothetical protein
VGTRLRSAADAEAADLPARLEALAGRELTARAQSDHGIDPLQSARSRNPQRAGLAQAEELRSRCAGHVELQIEVDEPAA